MESFEQLQRQFHELPPEKQEEVADFVAYLSARYRRHKTRNRMTIMRYAGLLKDSSNLTEDPLDLQRRLRDEW